MPQSNRSESVSLESVRLWLTPLLAFLSLVAALVIGGGLGGAMTAAFLLSWVAAAVAWAGAVAFQVRWVRQMRTVEAAEGRARVAERNARETGIEHEATKRRLRNLDDFLSVEYRARPRWEGDTVVGMDPVEDKEP